MAVSLRDADSCFCSFIFFLGCIFLFAIKVNLVLLMDINT